MSIFQVFRANRDGETVEVRKILDVRTHPEWTNKEFKENGDMAILILNKEWHLFVEEIPLPNPHVYLVRMLLGSNNLTNIKISDIFSLPIRMYNIWLG